jgi:hypothetical protein
MIEIIVTEYEMSHGKRPRGIGQWAFQMGYRAVSEPYWVTGSYGTAVKIARQKARELGVSVIVVLP